MMKSPLKGELDARTCDMNEAAIVDRRKPAASSNLSKRENCDEQARGSEGYIALY